ncbi:hypothetical protein V8F20_011781 [Naviculisporaceae sp. PSN 640]
MYTKKEILFVESSSSIAWIGAMQSHSVLLDGLISSPIYDLGYFKHLLLSGSSLIALLDQEFCSGMGAGLLFVPSLAVWPAYFSSTLGLASGSLLGGVIYLIMCFRLINEVGFGWAARGLGFVVLTTLLVPIFFIEDGDEARHSQSHHRLDSVLPGPVLFPGALICGGLTFAMIGVKILVGIIIITLLFGFFSGVFIALPPVCFVQMTADKSRIGTRLGMGFACLGCGVLAGGPGGGSILGVDPNKHWTSLWVYGGPNVGLLGIMLACLRFWLSKGKLMGKILCRFLLDYLSSMMGAVLGPVVLTTLMACESRGFLESGPWCHKDREER